jgi:predicted dehydrogenase
LGLLFILINSENKEEAMDTIKWGIIGCGKMTEKKSGPAFNRIKNSQLMAVMRRNAREAKDYAQRHGVPKWYQHAEEVIQDPEINAIYVATPPSSHAKYTIMAAKAGKHVYVEKPMAINFSECLAMIKAAEDSGVSLFVAYYRRSLPYFKKVKQILESGVIGRPRFVNVRLFKPLFKKTPFIGKLPWRYDQNISGGGLFVDLGSHQLDYLDYLFGSINSVKGHAKNQGGQYPVEDIVTASFMFESGVMGTGAWCFSVSVESDTDSIEIIGIKGKISFSTFNFTPIQVATAKGIETHEFPRFPHIQEPLIQTIVDSLQHRGHCPSTGVSASRTTRVMENLLKDYYSKKNHPSVHNL